LAVDAPGLDDIRANRARLGDLVVTTPVRRLLDEAVTRAVGEQTGVWLKEELFQRTGSFKPRGALSVMLDLDAAALARGVTGVSAGNHAISLAYSARQLGTTARGVMPRNNPRILIPMLLYTVGCFVAVVVFHLSAAMAIILGGVFGAIFLRPREGGDEP